MSVDQTGLVDGQSLDQAALAMPACAVTRGNSPAVPPPALRGAGEHT